MKNIIEIYPINKWENILILSIFIILINHGINANDGTSLEDYDTNFTERNTLTNDAGTGQDAGENITNAITIDAVEGDFTGHLLSSNDDLDVYLIKPPKDYFICIILRWDVDADLDLVFGNNISNGNIAKSSLSWGDEQYESITHNNFNDETLFFGVELWDAKESTGYLEYEVSIVIDSEVRVNAICQDDGGTGRDAYGYSGNNYTRVLPMNSPGITTTSGYISVNEDSWDVYFIDIPEDKGIAVWAYFDQSEVDIKVSMQDENDWDNGEALDFSYDNYPEVVSSNGSNDYPGGVVENLRIYINVGAEQGEGEYTLNWWLFEIDSDGDGVFDVDDDFPDNRYEWQDTDSDGIGDNTDNDDDGDNWSDYDEQTCITDSLDSSNFPEDNDLDTICDYLDPDDDNDGRADEFDDFPFDPTEIIDTDGDGIGNNEDTDDDNDGWDDLTEVMCNSLPLGSSYFPTDTDNDELCNYLDIDDDGDTFNDEGDRFPLNPLEWFDADEDGIGDNEDIDDDNDDVEDQYDNCNGFDDNLDYDGDLIPDDCDIDDDNDGINDEQDICSRFFILGKTFQGEDLFLEIDYLQSDDNIDEDDDGTPDGCDILVDNDGDGVSNALDKCEGESDSIDIDNDGIPDKCDFWAMDSNDWKIYSFLLIFSILFSLLIINLTKFTYES